jgi:hypothetical protein
MKNKIENMSKNMKIAIGAIILVIILALIVRGVMHKKAAPEAVVSTPVVEQPVAPKPAKWVAPKPAPTPVVVDTRGYAELIVAYKDRMLQFSDACQVRVSDQNYKIGSEMLLDNRNSVPVTIKLGSNSYTLPAYGHQVVTLGAEGKFMVDCNDHQNVATVSVQK